MSSVVAYNIRNMKEELAANQADPDPDRASYFKALEAKIAELEASLEAQ